MRHIWAPHVALPPIHKSNTLTKQQQQQLAYAVELILLLFLYPSVASSPRSSYLSSFCHSMSFWLSYFARFVLSLPNHLQTQAHTHTHAKQQHTRPRKQQILTEGENERANTSSKIEIARESSNPIKSKFMLFWWVFGLKIWNSEISFKRRLKHMTDFRIQCAVLCFAFFRIFISRSFQKQQQNNKNKRAPHTLVCSPIEWPLCMCDVLCSAQAHYYAGFAYVRIPFDSIELIYVMRAFNTSTFSIYARRRRRKKPN